MTYIFLLLLLLLLLLDILCGGVNNTQGNLFCIIRPDANGPLAAGTYWVEITLDPTTYVPGGIVLLLILIFIELLQIIIS
jgi:hypothetical protein